MTMIRRSVVSSSNGRGAMWPGHVDTVSAGDLLDAYSRRIAEGLAMRCGVRVCKRYRCDACWVTDEEVSDGRRHRIPHGKAHGGGRPPLPLGPQLSGLRCIHRSATATGGKSSNPVAPG